MKKIILATLGMGLLAIGVNANAASTGQGGVAGSAVMRLGSSIVTHVSSSIAIGKQSAYTGGSGGTGAATKAKTFAAGASGAVVISSGLITTIAIDPTLGTAQANGFGDGTITLDVNAGTYNGKVD